MEQHHSVEPTIASHRYAPSLIAGQLVAPLQDAKYPQQPPHAPHMGSSSTFTHPNSHQPGIHNSDFLSMLSMRDERFQTDKQSPHYLSAASTTGSAGVGQSTSLHSNVLANVLSQVQCSKPVVDNFDSVWGHFWCSVNKFCFICLGVDSWKGIVDGWLFSLFVVSSLQTKVVCEV